MSTILDRSGNSLFSASQNYSSNDHALNIARGKIRGASLVRIIGVNTDIDDAREDVWEVGGTYAFPAAGGIQMRIVSASANDTEAGTGIRTVHLHYLDNDYIEQEETLVLNGATPVNTVATNILRIVDLHTVTAGTGGVAAGNVSLTNVAGTVTYAMITTSNNRNRQAIYTVPAGKRCIISEAYCGAGAASPHYCEVMLRATTNLDNSEALAGIFNHKWGTVVQDSAATHYFSSYLPFPEKTDIKITAVSDAANANVRISAGFAGWVEDV